MTQHVPPSSSLPLPQAGAFDKAHFYLPLRVYYEDTDFSGSVYHASYLRFMERGRTEFLRAYDVNQNQLMAGEHASPIGFVVRQMEIDFRKPAVMDDALVVDTFMAELGGASFDLEQVVWRRDDVLVAAKVRIACVSGGRPARIPPQIRLKLTK
jgi:acyl-CoA thioester hydrolase